MEIGNSLKEKVNNLFISSRFILDDHHLSKAALCILLRRNYGKRKMAVTLYEKRGNTYYKSHVHINYLSREHSSDASIEIRNGQFIGEIRLGEYGKTWIIGKHWEDEDIIY